MDMATLVCNLPVLNQRVEPWHNVCRVAPWIICDIPSGLFWHTTVSYTTLRFLHLSNLRTFIPEKIGKTKSGRISGISESLASMQGWQPLLWPVYSLSLHHLPYVVRQRSITFSYLHNQPLGCIIYIRITLCKTLWNMYNWLRLAGRKGFWLAETSLDKRLLPLSQAQLLPVWLRAVLTWQWVGTEKDVYRIVLLNLYLWCITATNLMSFLLPFMFKTKEKHARIDPPRWSLFVEHADCIPVLTINVFQTTYCLFMIHFAKVKWFNRKWCEKYSNITGISVQVMAG